MTPLSNILLAIHLSLLPGNHPIEKRLVKLAETIQERSDHYNIDPYLVVAIAAHESQFKEYTRSPDGLDIGLMQIRVKYNGNNINYLLDGVNNIKVGTNIIQKDIDFCRKYLSREPTTDEWLAGYTGSIPWCKANKLTKQFVTFATCIKDDVENNTDHRCVKIYWNYAK